MQGGNKTGAEAGSQVCVDDVRCSVQPVCWGPRSKLVQISSRVCEQWLSTHCMMLVEWGTSRIWGSIDCICRILVILQSFFPNWWTLEWIQSCFDLCCRSKRGTNWEWTKEERRKPAFENKTNVLHHVRAVCIYPSGSGVNSIQHMVVAVSVIQIFIKLYQQVSCWGM